MLPVTHALLLVGTQVAAEAPAAVEAPTPEAIAQAIRDLGGDRFADREKASRFLWAAGAAAEPALEKAAASPDPEVSRRAKAVLDRFRWGIYPDTPRELVALIDRYRAGTQEAKRDAAGELA